MAHDTECPCVDRHAPEPHALITHHVVPLAEGGTEDEVNLVRICPTGYENMKELISHWDALDFEPPWVVRRKFSPFVRDLAERTWRAANPDKRFVKRTKKRF